MHKEGWALLSITIPSPEESTLTTSSVQTPIVTTTLIGFRKLSIQNGNLKNDAIIHNILDYSKN